MSRPSLTSAVRRISRPRPRATVSGLTPSAPTLSSSASLCHSSYRTSASPATLNQSSRARSNLYRVPRTCLITTQKCSPFSSSATRPAAQVTQNPRVDEEGKTLMMDISARAAKRLREITDPSSTPSTTKHENPYHHLRITVTSGGCHGFQYLMSLEAASKIDADEDTIFEAEASEEGSAGSAKVVMDEPSLELLSGSTVDYTTELIGSQFKIVDNPRATSSCGCGTSFDVVD